MFQLIYICLILVELADAVPSKVGLGCVGLLLILLSTVSGFGICSLLGLKFNVATEQVHVPAMSLLILVDDQVF